MTAQALRTHAHIDRYGHRHWCSEKHDYAERWPSAGKFAETTVETSPTSSPPTFVFVHQQQEADAAVLDRVDALASSITAATERQARAMTEQTDALREAVREREDKPAVRGRWGSWGSR